MGLFDAFTFKKNLEKVFSKENIQGLLETIKNNIIEQVQSNIPGPEKMKIVEEKVLEYLTEKVKDCKNKLVLFLVEQIKKLVPTITQYVYNFLKAHIENL